MEDNGTIMRKVIRKGKVNRFEALDAFATLGTVVLNVVHALHR